MLFPALVAAAWAVAGVAVPSSEGGRGHLKGAAFVLTFSVAIMQPGLILIDHGHFQYNGIALGLTVCALTVPGHTLAQWPSNPPWSTRMARVTLSYIHTLSGPPRGHSWQPGASVDRITRAPAERMTVCRRQLMRSAGARPAQALTIAHSFGAHRGALCRQEP